MSTTLVARGALYNYTNTGSAIAAGGVVVLVSGSSGFCGIAVDAIAATTGTGVLNIGGPDMCVHQLKKHTGEAFTDAQLLYWDATNSRLTGNSTGNTRIGRSFGTYASAAATAQVILNQF